MKIVALSDTHNQLSKVVVPDGDVLVHCGDFGAAGNMAEWKQFINEFSKFPHPHKIATFGNHDVRSVNWLSLVKEEGKAAGIEFLVDESIVIDGVKFYGSPWVPRYGCWFWMLSRGEEIGRKWNRIPMDVDVLITHGPPHGKLDMSPYDKIPAGCEELMKRVEDVKPKIHLFGHIHDGYGTISNENTKFYNVAVCNERYDPVNLPVEITIDKK